MTISWKVVWVAVALAGPSCALIYSSDTPGAEARKLVGAGAKLIDVRGPDEYAEGHIDGAVNIPLGELEARLSEVGPVEVPVVVYCRIGGRSKQAAALLRERGWKQVHNLGPKSYW